MTDSVRIARGQLRRLAQDVNRLGLAVGGLALVVQNDPYNINAAYSWCLVAAVGMTNAAVPTHVPFAAVEPPFTFAGDWGTAQDVGVRCERLGCVPKDWLAECVGQLSTSTMRRVERAIALALGLQT